MIYYSLSTFALCHGCALVIALILFVHGFFPIFTTAPHKRSFYIHNTHCIHSTQGESHPIVPVMLEDARLATEMADEMLSE